MALLESSHWSTTAPPQSSWSWDTKPDRVLRNQPAGHTSFEVTMYEVSIIHGEGSVTLPCFGITAILKFPSAYMRNQDLSLCRTHRKNPPKLNNPMISSVRVNIYLTLTLAYWFPFCLYCALELFLWFIFSSISSRAVDLYFWTAKAALVLANGGIMHKLDWGRELYSGLGEHD